MGNSILDDNYDEDEQEFQRKKFHEMEVKKKQLAINEEFKLPEIEDKAKNNIAGKNNRGGP
jgi:hypothetical protein